MLSFQDLGENPDWAKVGDWWSERLHHLFDWEGSTGQRISKEGHASAETESWEIWSCDWEMLYATEGKGRKWKLVWFLFFSNSASCTHSHVVQDLTFLFVVGKQDAQLANARAERDSRRRQKEQMTDDTNELVAQIELLKRLVIHLFHTPPIFFFVEINGLRL